MNPFFFGSSKRPLFGMHHPPRGGPSRDSAVLLCPPIGQEYMRTHRAFRQLALQLTREGFHVLRFDYFGTGDSGGFSHEATVTEWRDNVAEAVDELRDTAAVTRVDLVGLRLGAALAAQVAAARDDVRLAVLWDPVVSGGDYLSELLAMAESPQRRNGSEPEIVGVNGFPLSGRLRSELGAIDLTSLERWRGGLVVTSDSRPEWDELVSVLNGSGATVYQCIPTRSDWDNVDRLGAALLPQKIIQRIVRYLSDGE